MKKIYTCTAVLLCTLHAWAQPFSFTHQTPTPAVTTVQNVPAYVPTNGLVGWYPFTGNADDSSGNGHHALVNAAILAPDRYGNANAAYSFNGNTAYLHGNASSFPSGDRTIALWFYTTNINAGTAGMQAFGYGGGLCGASWLMQMDNTTPITSFFTDNTYEISLGCNNFLTALPFGVNGTPADPNSSWHHWVVTNGPTGVDYYIDGSYAGGVTTTVGNTLVAGKKFFMGSCPDSTGVVAYQDAYLHHWNGLLDDIGIWSRALTPQEITTLYNGGTVGLAAVSSPSAVSVFPNPVQEVLTIQVQQAAIGTAFTLIDSYGRTVMNGTINNENMQVAVGALAKGAYLLRFDHAAGHSVRLIKE